MRSLPGGLACAGGLLMFVGAMFSPLDIWQVLVGAGVLVLGLVPVAIAMDL